MLTELALVELLKHELADGIHEMSSSLNRLLAYVSTDDAIDDNTSGPIIGLIPGWSDEIRYVTCPSIKAPLFDAIR